VRVAVTGAGGRLGRALVAALEDAPFTGPFGPIAWTRDILDLDTVDAGSVAALLQRDRPEVVIHAAAWTDVDGCAREPALAMRRNAEATAAIAAACATARDPVDLVLVSTNEVFPGDRTDGRGYGPHDPTRPANPYAASKLAGEQRAAAAYVGAHGPARLAIVRTSWLFGPGAPDFPRKILVAAAGARATGERLRAVADEWGCPTYVADLAEAIVELLAEDALTGALAPDAAPVAIHHLVNAGVATRADWAREVLRLARVDVEVEDVPASTWPRASTPPRWGVLEPTPLPSGEPMAPWRDAMGRYGPEMLRSR